MTPIAHFGLKLAAALKHLLVNLCLLLCTLWLGMALWVQQPVSSPWSGIVIAAWLGLAMCVIFTSFKTFRAKRKPFGLVYIAVFALGLIWYFNLPAQQNRQWAPEVAKQLHYEQSGSVITLHNVRNFDWHTETDYTERWETRRYDLNQITGINVITSYWMGPQIAHTLVSFDFKDQAPLVFSIEIRKEQTEQFSAVGGFFRQFELSLIAADEHDIVYTRSNARGEQVYFFPISHMPKKDMQSLFMAYLQQADALKAQPSWYNSLTSNCTTIIYGMAKKASQTHLPLDYRLIASGYLPNYLYDIKALPHQWDMPTWYQRAHVNPRVSQQADLNSAEYSRLIRLGLPAALPAQE